MKRSSSMKSVNGHPIHHREVTVRIWGEGPTTFRVGDDLDTKEIVVHDTGVAVYFPGGIEFFPFHNVFQVSSVEVLG